MTVSTTLTVRRHVHILPESLSARDVVTGQDYPIHEDDIRPGEIEVDVEMDLTVTAKARWSRETGVSRRPGWEIDDVTARTAGGEEIWLSAAEESDAVARLELAADAEAGRAMEDACP